MVKLPSLDRREQRLWLTMQFFARLLALSVPLYLVMAFLDLSALQHAAASGVAWVLQAAGWQVAQEGALLAAGSGVQFHFLVGADCTAWKSMVFLFALLFAVPGAAPRKRLLGLVIGLPVVWLANIGRIAGIVAAHSAYGAEAAMLAHDVLWQFGLVVLVLAVWGVWLRFASGKGIIEGKPNNKA
jgi:exosortase/archaeosortase family protein